MPKGYLKLKSAIMKSKKYSGKSEKKKEQIAAKIWNKSHKGTGKTVGKGRK